jgi:hypothetical protein
MTKRSALSALLAACVVALLAACVIAGFCFFPKQSLTARDQATSGINNLVQNATGEVTKDWGVITGHPPTPTPGPPDTYAAPNVKVLDQLFAPAQPRSKAESDYQKNTKSGKSHELKNGE